ncbi:MAG TPA: phosphatidylglycerophosphatase A [Verrucomicrobiae bacterium]|nr:phosphatidylglycerophosphatase A [Verrucomicrobiae bacterium]
MDLGRPQDRAPRPPARLIYTTPAHFIAFGAGAGLSRKAPGTVGTVWGLPFWLVLHGLPPVLYVIAVAALFAFGVWICGRSAKLLGVPDHSGIVFDEIVGFLVTAAPLIPGLGLMSGRPEAAVLLLVAFGVFRFFDIAKPWPISQLDARVHGGFGIMLDDLVAGLYGAALVWLFALLI